MCYVHASYDSVGSTKGLDVQLALKNHSIQYAINLSAHVLYITSISLPHYFHWTSRRANAYID